MSQSPPPAYAYGNPQTQQYYPQQPQAAYPQQPAYGQQQPAGYAMQPAVGYPAQAPAHVDHHYPDDHHYGGGKVSDVEKAIRLGFIRKVYIILALQLSVVTAIVCAFMFSKGAQEWLVQRGWFVFICLIFALGTLFGLYKKKESYPANLLLLGAFTILEAITIASTCARYTCDPVWDINGDFVACETNVTAQRTVGMAFGVTMAVFLGLTAYTCQSKYDFTLWGSGLSTGIMCLLFWGLFIIIFGGGFVAFYLWGLVAAGLFCAFIIYDTHRVLKRLGPDDWVVGAVSIFIDIIVLFQIILCMSRGRD